MLKGCGLRGIGLSERYFRLAALPLLRAHFPSLEGRCAAALCSGGLDAGCGSEVYGWDSGLELNDLTASTEMADGVAYLFTVGSGTIAQEGSLPKSFFNTDEATTDAAVAALLTPATEA